VYQRRKEFCELALEPLSRSGNVPSPLLHATYDYAWVPWRRFTNKLMNKTITVAVIGGCGHVGLPLSIALARHYPVHIVDIDTGAAESVRAGIVPFREEGAEPELRQVIGKSLHVHTTPEIISEVSHVVVVIGTPVDEHLNPDFTLFDRVLEQLGGYLRPGQTLILRSTIFPGTTSRVARLLADRGLAVEVAFCPERVAEGFALREIRGLPQIVSGTSTAAVAAARALFEPTGAELIELPPEEAELAKLFTNAWRYITFSVANQFQMIATNHGLSFSRILQAMKHNYPRAQTLPGPGFAAGPCLFKDTMQLAAYADNQFFLGHAAMLVNEGMPRFLVDRIKTAHPDLSQRTVGILGMAFKSGSDDSRESLSYKLKKILQIECRQVLTADPYVKNDPGLVPHGDVLSGSDILVVGVPHPEYRNLMSDPRPIYDLWSSRF
jgi:UDP-N-acetyl-D-mannosaminuronic acid dehydrogenase